MKTVDEKNILTTPTIWFRIEKEGSFPMNLEAVTIKDIDDLKTKIKLKASNDIPCSVPKLRLEVILPNTSQTVELNKDLFKVFGNNIQFLINTFKINQNNPIKVFLPEVSKDFNRMAAASIAACAAVGLITAPVTIPLAVGAMGFTSGGILAGSVAAQIMASYGGAVTAGSACAVLQSIGATATIGYTAAIATTTLGGISGVVSGIILRKEKEKLEDDRGE